MSNSNRERFQIDRTCFARIRKKILAQYFYAIIFAKLFQSFWFENTQSKLGFDEQNDRTICYSGIEKVSWYQLDLICYFHVWNWETLQFEVVWVEGLQNITIIGLYKPKWIPHLVRFDACTQCTCAFSSIFWYVF